MDAPVDTGARAKLQEYFNAHLPKTVDIDAMLLWLWREGFEVVPIMRDTGKPIVSS